MYTFHSRVRFSETDEEEKLTVTGILNYLQDCCVFHSQDYGAGNAWQRSRDKVWMLASWQIDIEDRPPLFEEIEIGTQCYEFSGLYGKRNNWIRGMDGRYYVRAASLWCIVSPSTGKVVRIGGEDMAPYDVEPPLEMEYAGRRLRLPAERQPLPSFRVTKGDLDSNHHVNNSRYIGMALDCLPEAFIPRQVRAEYRAQATLGSLICPVLGRDGDCYTVSLENEEKTPYAVVECRKQ